MSRSAVRFRGVRRLGSAAVLAVAASIAFTASPAAATTSVTVTPVFGANRYATASQIADGLFDKSGPSRGSSTVVLASGVTFPDGLSASYLAGRLRAPILYTDPNTLSPEALTAIRQIGATSVDVVGGTAAVSDAVASQLAAAGLAVTRIAGADRYATATLVDRVFPASFVGSLGSGGPTALVASGATFGDAMTIGPLGYLTAFPLFLTPPTTLPSEVSQSLGALGIKQVILLGGTSALSPAVESSITGLGIAVNRIGGADRTQTATLLAQFELNPANRLGFTSQQVELVRGDDFADGLAASVAAGLEKAPILLTEDPHVLGPFTTAFLQAAAPTLQTILAFGGPAAMSNAVLSSALSAAGGAG